MAAWEIEAAIRTWLKTLNFVVDMFIGGKKKKPKTTGFKTNTEKDAEMLINHLRNMGIR
jgi:hypothetical protein